MKLNILAVFILLLPSVLHADIQRSCQAYYEIERVAVVIPPPHPPAVGVERILIKLGHFSAKGSCGRVVPNRCRERARNLAHRCMSDHWAVLRGVGDMGTAPCTGSSIVNYPISNEYLKGVINDWVCNTFHAESMSVRVNAVTNDNTGCPRSRVLASNYRIRCNR